jgi:hypothetical protein
MKEDHDRDTAKSSPAAYPVPPSVDGLRDSEAVASGQLPIWHSGSECHITILVWHGWSSGRESLACSGPRPLAPGPHACCTVPLR